jgi:RNA polymerase sigma factor (TIGR02999 family)
MTAGGEVTRLLERWRGGEPDALQTLIPLVYDELHRLAERHMRGERAGHTLQPTALVAEACVRLLGEVPREYQNRAHFVGVAAHLMRQILVDHARKRSAVKRGGGEKVVTIDDMVAGAASTPEELVALDDLLAKLAAFDERKAKIVELRHFGGLTQEEIATVLDVHVNTVVRDLRVAEAWLRARLDETPG